MVRRNKAFLSLVLTILLFLSMVTPVFSQNITYKAGYNIDGKVDSKMQIGHTCNTGSEMKQSITGEGTISKIMEASLEKGKLTVDDIMDWVTAEDALRNLTVTSVIELCAPPKLSL